MAAEIRMSSSAPSASQGASMRPRRMAAEIPGIGKGIAAKIALQ